MRRQKKLRRCLLQLQLKLTAFTPHQKKMLREKIRIYWAYAVEVVAASTVLVAICLWLDCSVVISFVREVALDLATLFGAVMLAASLGFLWTFYSKSDTDFYRWLDTRGAFRIYLFATAYSVGVSAISTLTLVILKKITDQTFALFSIFMLILAVINLTTLVRNVIDLMLLNAKFNQTRTDT